MKKFVVLLVGIVLFACSQKDGFKINVNLEGAEGKVVLEERRNGQWIGVDTADVVDGKAVLEGAVEVPGVYYLSVLGQGSRALVFVENSTMTITGKADSIGSVAVAGSATHAEYEKLNAEINKVEEEYMGIYQEARAASAAGDMDKSKELLDKVDEMYESTLTMQEEYVKNHPSSFATPYFLNAIQYDKDANELDSLVNSLDPNVQLAHQVVDLKARIEKMKKVAVGQVALNFVQNDADGNPVDFSEIYSKNKLTLLDFWASWCGPCRQENPNVVAVFNEFNDQGFDVFGVSLDRDKDSWQKAVKDDNLTWTHVSDLAYWNNEVAKMYAVNSIPHSILIAQDGTIIAKNKRGDELRAVVQEYLAN